ncbi:paraquat-inducible protein A [Ruficoccus amylovorans]|uniref:Paraquat-inducible protein A n=1 Tax=Ruficoccus amylovorans TaxID=1804625 RepID=A0A842HEI2_9BACT|nr:paraquat-inducible protein A [Ruficoccus amylovorans]MBC2594630.1 paraquat-inducible protein A [Ruficoccus amylovorans]
MKPGFWGVENYLPVGEPESKSILSGICHLALSGDLFLASLLLGFSVLFPVWKLCVFYSAVYRLEHGLPATRSLKFAGTLGKFSMLDVIVMGMLVLAFQSFPGGTRIHIEWGIGFFLLSVILSIVASIQIKPLSH